MAIIVDASVLVVLASGDARRATAADHLRRWLDAGEELPAPTLLPYEVASGLTRLAAAGALPADRLAAAWRTVMAVPPTFHPLRADGEQAVEAALTLARHSAYDAAYLVQGARLGAPLGTLDGPLARNARARGHPVHLLE